MNPGREIIWRCRDRTLTTGARTLIMGVLNVTPDSFSDGGRFADPHAAIAHARSMAEAGADIIDIGGESSRQGSVPVTAEEEWRRVGPVLEALCKELPCLVSVDTTKAGVARKALACGAHIVNDISALTHDPGMMDAVREAGAGVVLMHMQGQPRTMQDNPQYDDVVTDVARYLSDRVSALTARGLSRETLAIDPGIGFGKTVEHNVQLLARLRELQAAGRPLVVGLSRKSFLGKLTGASVQDRLPASLAGMAYALLKGADILRVHDVKESCEIARLMDIFRQAERDT